MSIIIPQYLANVTFDHAPNSTEIEIKPQAIVEEPIFLRNNIIIFQDLNKINGMSPSFTVNWLTISQCNITFKHISFRCKIQVTARSEIIADDCTFVPIDDRCECAVEIFANSKGNFTNCTFTSATKAGIAIRDRSEATFRGCKFTENSNTSILVLDRSRANIFSCNFESADRFSVYLYRNSIALLKESHFLSQKGKALFLLTGSQAHVINCEFFDCNGGAISIADSSDVYVRYCRFHDIGSSSVHAMKNSKAFVFKCILERCKGNGVNFEYSTGYIYKCKFDDFYFPAIACFGPKAVPVIYDSVLKNCHSIAIVSRDCAAPRFCKVNLFNIQSHGFSISDFSHATIENCILKNISKSPFCIFNGATPIIDNCIIIYKDNPNALIFQAFTNGKVSFKNNKILSNNENLFVKIHNFGRVMNDEFKSNYFCIADNNQNDQILSNGRLISIDNDFNITIEKDISKLHVSFSLNKIEKIENDTSNDYFKKDEEEEEEEEENDSTGKSKQPPKSLFPKAPLPISLNKNAPMISGDSNFSINNGRQSFVSQGPQHLDPLLKPLDLPKPLEEIDIRELMQTECKADNDIHIENNNNDNNNQNENGDVDAAAIGHLHLGTCMRCHNGLADFVVIPCGHKVLCKKCAEECSPNTCPLCETPIQKCTEEFVEAKCVICLDNQCDTIILPCGHKCICYECATRLWTEKKQCPLCQTRVLSFRHMFQIYSEEEKREAATKFNHPK
ncbi:hypothetical protein M9Y10_037429 [Tritrichomonas musculus]|uniref:RING-type domain-containing protein n=1 Tax=Tritrichomonas musculus TaxID=1915356 RepID=A0ABR2GSJ4_9EUKA